METAIVTNKEETVSVVGFSSYQDELICIDSTGQLYRYDYREKKWFKFGPPVIVQHGQEG